MKLNVIKLGYINISDNIYPNDYINLARIDIKNKKLAFDERTLFLTEDEKKKLNRDLIREFDDMVIIFKLFNSWGILCNLPIKYYSEKKVLCHELVLPDVVQRMLSNFHGYNAEANPVMLTHNKKLDLSKFVEENSCDFKCCKGIIELFIYQGAKAEKILNKLEGIEYFYIADGHHRLFTTSVYPQKEEVMACVYEMSQLKIETIPRKIPNIPEKDYHRFVEKIKQRFKIKENREKLNKGEVRLTYNGESITFELWNVDGDLFANNDIYRLNTQVISNIFRIFKDEEIEYLSEEELKKELSANKKDIIYIETAPMNKEEFMDTIENDNIMPPKSTYFKPKFPSFLIFNYFKK